MNPNTEVAGQLLHSLGPMDYWRGGVGSSRGRYVEFPPLVVDAESDGRSQSSLELQAGGMFNVYHSHK